MNRELMARQMFAKGGAAFPDLSGDGQVTQKDILMGRGVIPMREGGSPFPPGDPEGVAKRLTEEERRILEEMYRQQEADRRMEKRLEEGRREQEKEDRNIIQRIIDSYTGRPQFSPGDPDGGSVQDFAYGGQVNYMQEGGMAPVNPMVGMPAPQDAAMPPMAQAGGIDPAIMEQMLMRAQQGMTSLDEAESAEEVMNAMRGDEASVEERRMELADIVGPEDAQQTPESVLTLVQPVMMMAQVDQGIGGLAQEQMGQPVSGDMAQGIMSTVDMGAEEGPAPVNFNQGGVVGMQAGGDPLTASYESRLPLYEQIAGIDPAEIQRQKELDQAQMLFALAQGGLQLASPTDRRMSTAEKLAMAGQGVLQNISGITAGAAQRKAQQDATMRQARLGALQAAETDVAAKAKIKAESQKRKEVTIDGQVIDITDPKNPFVIFGDRKKDIRSVGGLLINVSDPEKPEVIYGTPDTKTVTVKDQVIDITDPKNPFVIYGDETRDIRSIDGQLIDITNPQNPFVVHGTKKGDIRQIGDKLIDISDVSNPKIIYTGTESKTVTVGDQIVDITDPKNPFVIFGDKKKDWKVVDGQLFEIVDGEPVLRVGKDQTGDLFASGATGRIQNILAGPNAVSLAKKYANNTATEEEANIVETAIQFYTNPQSYYDPGLGQQVKVEANKLTPMWIEALKKRRSNFPDASFPSVGLGATELGVDEPSPRLESDIKIEQGAPVEKEEEITFQDLIKRIQDPETNVTGRTSAIKLFFNKFYEVISGDLLFKEAEEAKTNLSMINTAATASLVGAVPGRESEQFRQELKAILPDIGKFTVGNETSVLQFRAAETFFNNEIAALMAKKRAVKPIASVGEIDRAITSLESFRDAYSTMRRRLEAETRMQKRGGKRQPLETFLKSGRGSFKGGVQ